MHRSTINANPPLNATHRLAIWGWSLIRVLYVLPIWVVIATYKLLFSRSEPQSVHTTPPNEEIPLETHFEDLNLQTNLLQYREARKKNPQAPFLSECLPGMDFSAGPKNQQADGRAMAEVEELSRLRAREENNRRFASPPAPDQGIRFGVPSMGERSGIHRPMGSRPGVQQLWDRRTVKSSDTSIDSDMASSFDNLRL